MKILSAFVGSYPRVKQEKRQFQNSFALQKDTVSFGAKVAKEKLSSSDYYSGITLELISDNNVREIVSRIISTEGQEIPLSAKDYIKVINYFGYRRNSSRDHGDHVGYDRDKSNLPNGQFVTAHTSGSGKDKNLDHGAIAKLRCGLRNVNRFNGELYLGATTAELETIADEIVRESSNFISKNDKNKYREALSNKRLEYEAEQAEQEQKRLETQRREADKSENLKKASEIQKQSIVKTCEDFQSIAIEFYDGKLSELKLKIEMLQSYLPKFPNFTEKINAALNSCREFEAQLEQKRSECLDEFEKARTVTDDSELKDYYAMHNVFEEIQERSFEFLGDIETDITNCINRVSQIEEDINKDEIEKLDCIKQTIDVYTVSIGNLKNISANWSNKLKEIEDTKINEPTYNDEALCNNAKELQELYQKAIKSVQEYIVSFTERLEDIETNFSERRETIKAAYDDAVSRKQQAEDLVKYYLFKIEQAENNLKANEDEYYKAEQEFLKNKNERIRRKFEQAKLENIQETPRKETQQSEELTTEPEIPRVVIEDTPVVIKLPASEKSQIIIPKVVSFSNKTKEIMGEIISKMLPFKLQVAQADMLRLLISTLDLENNPTKLEQINVGDFKAMLTELTKTFSKSAQYKNIIRSLMFAIQSEARTYSISEATRMANKGMIDMEMVKNMYTKLSQPLSDNDKISLQNTIFKYCPNLSESEKERAKDLILKQSKYMNLLNEANNDKEVVKQVLNLFWSDFGNPEYAELSIKEYENELRNKFIEENTFVDDDDFE